MPCKPPVMTIHLTQVEKEIIAYLACGTYQAGAYDLIVRKLGRAWWHGYRCLRNLERRGVIVIERQPHKPHQLSLVGGADGQ